MKCHQTPTAGGHADLELHIFLGLENTHSPLLQAAVGKRAEQCLCPEKVPAFDLFVFQGLHLDAGLSGPASRYQVPAQGPAVRACSSPRRSSKWGNFSGSGEWGGGPEFQEAFGAPAGCQQAPCSLGNVCEGEGMKPAPPSACLGDPLPPKNVRASASSPTRHTHRAWPAPKGRSPFQVAFGGTEPPRGVGRAEDWVAHSLTHPLMGFRLLKHFVRCEANLSFLVGHCRRD